jgi:hypothetical protein
MEEDKKESKCLFYKIHPIFALFTVIYIPMSFLIFLAECDRYDSHYKISVNNNMYYYGEMIIRSLFMGFIIVFFGLIFIGLFLLALCIVIGVITSLFGYSEPKHEHREFKCKKCGTINNDEI